MSRFSRCTRRRLEVRVFRCWFITQARSAPPTQALASSAGAAIQGTERALWHPATGCFRRRIQPVDATHSLNISAGVWKPSVLRGLSFNCRAIALSWSCE